MRKEEAGGGRIVQRPENRSGSRLVRRYAHKRRPTKLINMKQLHTPFSGHSKQRETCGRRNKTSTSSRTRFVSLPATSREMSASVNAFGL